MGLSYGRCMFLLASYPMQGTNIATFFVWMFLVTSVVIKWTREPCQSPCEWYNAPLPTVADKPVQGWPFGHDGKPRPQNHASTEMNRPLRPDTRARPEAESLTYRAWWLPSPLRYTATL